MTCNPARRLLVASLLVAAAATACGDSANTPADAAEAEVDAVSRPDGTTSDGGRNPDIGSDDADAIEDALADAPADADAGDVSGDGGADAAADGSGGTDATDADAGDAADDVDVEPCLIDCPAPGARRCDERGLVESCADPDGDGCYAWGSPRACSAGTVCSDGVCGASDCESECESAGVTSCEGSGAVRVCDNRDADPCLEWAPALACGDGSVCEDGRCTPPCEDACPTAGATVCTRGGLATCDDFDEDRCLEPGPPTPCEEGTVCEGGACVALDPDAECLVISEYIEGSSNNKAIEVQNCGLPSVDLDDVRVCLMFNGNTSSCGQSLELGGELAPAEVRVLCNDRIATAARGACDTLSGSLSFNGDDLLLLFRDGDSDGILDASDEILDAIGSRSSPPSSEIWSEVTYRRCERAAFDATGAYDVLDYFTAAGRDDLSDLGSPSAFGGCP